MPALLNPAAPGELALTKGFIDLSHIEEVNESVLRENILAQFLITYDDLILIEQIQHPAGHALSDIPAPLGSLIGKVVGSVPFTYSSLELYIRHLHRPNRPGLGVHIDVTRDKRILIEGHGATWIFDRERQLASYPHGLPLGPGDAVTLNNECNLEEQLRHGVTMNPELTIRTSYLFNFS